jgi:hypothetical protein
LKTVVDVSLYRNTRRKIVTTIPIGMIIITWCLSKMRSAYAAGKRAVTSALSCCSGSAGQVDGTYGSNNVPVNGKANCFRGGRAIGIDFYCNTLLLVAGPPIGRVCAEHFRARYF